MSHALETGTPERPVSRRRSPVRQQKVLVVDDDAGVLRAMRRQLGLRYQVETAGSAEAAATRLATDDYDAIVTDFNMPVYNGLWLLTQVASRYPAMKRVMISGQEQGLLAPHIRSGLIQHFCRKPITAGQVEQALEP